MCPEDLDCVLDVQQNLKSFVHRNQRQVDCIVQVFELSGPYCRWGIDKLVALVD
jgi:hypothetical protein